MGNLHGLIVHGLLSLDLLVLATQIIRVRVGIGIVQSAADTSFALKLRDPPEWRLICLFALHKLWENQLKALKCADLLSVTPSQ